MARKYGGKGGSQPPMTSMSDVTRVSKAKRHAGPGAAYKPGASSLADVTKVGKARQC